MKHLVYLFSAVYLLQACSVTNNAGLSNNTEKTYIKTNHEFSKRKTSALNAPKNSVTEQKNKQIVLHTYYFNSYSQNKGYYTATESNPHLEMLNKSISTTKLTLDSNKDGKITIDEIKAFVTSDSYLKYFRSTYIDYSFKKLDADADSKLSADEFAEFNTKIKDQNLADFQTLEEFEEFDYNSTRALEIEEYEDFFADYLLMKVGAKS